MSYTLLHHPGCSTSRKGLDLLRENGVEPEIRKYATVSGRLTVEELREIAAMMGGVSPRVFLRAKDAEQAGLLKKASDDAVFAAMAEHPKLIQRPIGVKDGKAVIGRPIENLLDLI